MIVQNAAAPDAEHFVITMDEHTAFAAQLALAFGNDRFEPVAPRALMLHVVQYHDAGWRALDASAPRDPATGLPYHLVKTPLARIVETSAASADFNAERHAFCGLLSSMHVWGLYNGRFGMSDKVLLNELAAENRAIVDGMLAREAARQERLRAELAANPDTAPWVEPARLMQNYKQLQLFDTLALYFNCIPEGARGPAWFTHVPLNGTSDTEVHVTPLAKGCYAFDPFPFAEDGIEVTFTGRYLAPVAGGDDVRDALGRLPTRSQTVRLVARH